MLRRSRMVAGLVAVAVVTGACTGPVPAADPAPPAPTTAAVAPPVGTPGWQLTDPGAEHAIEGFTDRVSVSPGEPVRLFVSTAAPSFVVTAFRMGAYRDSDAQAVWTSPPRTGGVQAPAVVQEPTHTVVAPWHPSMSVATQGWPPGVYLLRLDGSDGAQRFVPLTVRTPSNAGRVVVINAVTTWQAYNRWGGHSLYKGPDGQRRSRSRAVSFDRPYEAGMQGAGQFLQFELGFLRVAERSGVPLGYATDTDLHADPHLLDGARAMVTLGHDEYWTTAMRAAATAARDRGVNLAFLGGNEVYRHMRFAPTPLGDNRLEINYKSAAEDPVSRTDPTESTQDWRQPPDPRPESVLVGGYYSCFPGRADLVVSDATSWLLSGIVHDGERFPSVVGIEYAKVDLSVPTPRPMEVLFHSPVTCGTTGRREFSDATYYTASSGAGVFSSGTQDWVCGMDPGCKGSGNGGRVAQALDAITTRLLTEFAAGPAGVAHPARDNLDALGIGRTTAVPPSAHND
ncbi:N,N-dimethylformamidase beta subunit family domain-containing protein [Pseudonocardia sp. CA-107938]|uniref:N,N-dimethylformamidase beta subunit family domain-containing protein n=1 Tax=Pseudonocardia sp. CA-107938 TaxID=3240021 RepID=UPI003D8BD768